MTTHRRLMTAAAFFCACGWVCNGPAAYADEPGPAVNTNPAAPEDQADPLAQVRQLLNNVLNNQSAPAGTTPDAAAPTGESSPRPAATDITPPKPAPAGNIPDPGSVQVSNFDTVSLNVQNTDLANVLQLLSIQSKRNIVPSPKVSGTVTANLYDVTFHEALDAILQQNGATFVEKGNFIFVYTYEEFAKIQEAEKQVTFRLFELNYLTAEDASKFITPLLSSAGSIVAQGPVAPGFVPTTADGGANLSAHAERMLVRDYPEIVDMVAEALKTLDTRPKQVLIEATILRADLHEDLEFGVDMSILADLNIDDVSPLGVVNQMITGAVSDTPSGAITTTPGNVAEGEGGIKVGVLTNNVAVFIRALDKVTDTTIIANPKIMTLNRQRAEVLVGEKIGYLSTTATATATTQTVEFLDTGTQLSVRPFVDNTGYIRLELKPSISSAETRDVVSPSGVVTIPDEATQELTTNVLVRDGQTVVLGGLFKEETTIERNQVPGIGDIPILGNAFKGRVDDFDRSEVIFLVTPHILRDEPLTQAGASAADNIEMLRIGARNGLLPWSRSKFTAGHLREALLHLENNDRDKAMWEIDLALDLDPRMLEATRLKEKLSGHRGHIPGSSLLDDAVEIMIEQHTGKKRNDRRARPMAPSQRPHEPVSDREPLSAAGGASPVVPVAPAVPATPATAVDATVSPEQVIKAIEGLKVEPANDAEPTPPAPSDPPVVPASDTEPAPEDQPRQEQETREDGGK